MQITVLRFTSSSRRYWGRHVLSPLMGYDGFLSVELHNGKEEFTGGKLRARLSWQGQGGASDPELFGEIEIPSIGAEKRKRFKIPTRTLPFRGRPQDPVHLHLEVIQKKHGGEKTLASTSVPVLLSTEQAAKERIWMETITICIFVASFLTLLGVIASIVISVIKK